MIAKRLDAAIAEAKRFLKTAAECKKIQDQDSEYIHAGVETGAAKRASMDLTRALSQLRKSDYDK